MSKNSGLIFINKVLQAEDFHAFARNGITKESFVSQSERNIYQFIEEYYEKNGQTPSYALVSDKFDSFVYIPEITDRFEALAEGITNRKLAVEFNKFFDTEFERIQEETNGDTASLIEQINEGLSSIKSKYANARSVGIEIKKGTDTFLTEYNRRKEGKSFKTWKSFLPFLNDEIGGYTSGNLYVWYGRSGRGKSAVTLREAVEIAQQGANVLLWSLEMPSYDVLTRIYTILSAKLEKTILTTDAGTVLKAGFDSAELRNGKLSKEYEESFIDMLKQINTLIAGNIIIRAVDDLDFNKRNIAQIRADIETVNADVVIIDPFYYLDYEANTSKTSGGDASATSMKLRRLAGSANVAIFAMTQAEEDDKEITKDKIRELKMPTRKSVKKTKALLEDASTLIAIDTDYTQSRGIIGINKGRNGGEGTSAELTFLPQFGIIEQLEIEEDMFEF